MELYDEEDGGLRKAKRRALYLLGERDYCTAELKAKLLNNYDEEICDQVISYVTDCGYLDDENYARKLAEKLVLRKSYGKRRAKFDMLRKGLDGDIVEAALDGISEERLQEEITAYIEKKYGEIPEDYKERQKIVAALARRGYGFSDIKECVDRLRGKSDFDEDYPE